MEVQDYLFHDEKKKYTKRVFDDFFASCSTTIILLVGFAIGLKYNYVFWGFSLLTLLFLIRSMIWSYGQITKVKLEEGELILEYQTLDKCNELKVALGQIQVELKPVFVRDESYMLYLKSENVEVKQYPSNFWDTDKMKLMEELIRDNLRRS